MRTGGTTTSIRRCTIAALLAATVVTAAVDLWLIGCYRGCIDAVQLFTHQGQH